MDDGAAATVKLLSFVEYLKLMFTLTRVQTLSNTAWIPELKLDSSDIPKLKP